MAINWLGGGVDHPMADAKTAREIVEGFPTSDPPKTLQEATEWLESLNQTDGFRLNRRFDNIRLLEGAGREAHRRLLQDYLSTPRQQKYQENRLWNCAFAYCRQLQEGYIRCVREYDSGFAGITSIGISLPVLMGRAMRALALQLKWTLFRYGPVEPRIWGAIAGLFRMAEERGVSEGPILLYQGESPTTVKGEFLKAAMLAASSPDGLSPMKQEVAERIVAHLAGSLRLSKSPEGCTHAFDLALSKPPVRLFSPVEPAAMLRYFGAGEGLGRLEQLAAQAASGSIPADIDLGGGYEPALVGAVLKRLAQNWSPAPSARGSERRQTAGSVTVVAGLKELLSAIGAPAGGGEAGQPVPAESWIVDNMSDAGYGAIVPPKLGDWVRVGALAGLKGEASADWAVGLVRRIAIDEHQQRRVGIELLTRAAAVLALSMADSMTSLDFNLSTETGLLLAAEPDAEGEVGVLVGKGVLNGVFKERDKLELKAPDRILRVRLSRIVEAGEGYDWAKMKIVEG